MLNMHMLEIYRDIDKLPSRTLEIEEKIIVSPTIT